MTTNPTHLADLDRSVLADIAAHDDGVEIADLTAEACDASDRLRAAGYIIRTIVRARLDGPAGHAMLLFATDAGRAALAEPTEPTAPVRITSAYAEDIRARELAASYDGPANPYHKVVAVVGGQNVEFTRSELVELHADAEHYCSPGGPGSALSVGLRAAYRRVRDLARAALDSLPAEPPPVADLVDQLTDDDVDLLRDLDADDRLDLGGPAGWVLGEERHLVELGAARLIPAAAHDQCDAVEITDRGRDLAVALAAADLGGETPGDEDADKPVRLATGVELSPAAHEILLTVVGQPGILLDALDGDALRQLHDAELVTISAGRVGPTPLAVHLTAQDDTHVDPEDADHPGRRALMLTDRQLAATVEGLGAIRFAGRPGLAHLLDALDEARDIFGAEYQARGLA